MVDDPTIARLLGSQATSEAACQALVDMALDRGGRDNVTVIVAGYRVATES
jgi:serine/threonine protein phosphatase PrpC